jgi:hypothetical protein
MNRLTVLLTVVEIALLLNVGCNGGDSNSFGPVAPGNSPEITGTNIAQAQAGHTSLLGYYDIYLDIENQTAEVVANRTSEFTLNIVPFLNQMNDPPMGISFEGAFTYDDSNPGRTDVSVCFTWHHPFQALDQYKIYDFMGVVITNGTNYPGYPGLRRAKRGVDTYMTNADGYTRWFNPTEFTTDLIFGWTPGGIQNYKGNAHLNPYKYYAFELPFTGDLWEFLNGENNDGLFLDKDSPPGGRLMNLEFINPPTGKGLKFAYAAVCCWEEQGAGPYTPYHRKEVIACRATVTPDIYYTDFLNQGGNLILDIDLWAWDEQPSVVMVESTVLSAPVTITDPPIPGGDNYSTYHLDIPADALLGGTEGHEFWVIAESSGYNYVNIDGVASPPVSAPLAAYFRYPLFIADAPY